MKKILLAVMAMVTMSVAGGNIQPTFEPKCIECEAKLTGVYGGIFDGVQLQEDEVQNYGVLVGYEFNSFVAVEARADYSPDIYNYGAFVKGKYPIGSFEPYVLLGYSKSKAYGYKQDGVSYGVGTSYALNKRVNVFVDYVAYQDENINDSVCLNDSVNVGLTYKF